MEAIQGELTAAQLAAKHGIHVTMVGEWKRPAVSGLAGIFSGPSASDTQEQDAAILEKLHAFETGSEIRNGLTKWINYYNAECPHSTFNGKTPNECYEGKIGRT